MVNQLLPKKRIVAGLALIGVSLLCSFREMQDNSSNQDEVASLGRKVAGDLMANLQKALGEAMGRGGPIAAIEVCKKTALTVTARTAARYPGVEVRRTTLKLRNPKNRPDSLDEEVLRRLSQMGRSEKGLPQYWIRSVDSTSEPAYRFYQPILTSEFCLKCHGGTDTIPEDVSKVLKREYPEDQAVGYKSGELRGVISVQIPARILVRE